MLLEALQKNVMKRSSIFEVVLNTSVSNFLYLWILRFLEENVLVPFLLQWQQIYGNLVDLSLKPNNFQKISNYYSGTSQYKMVYQHFWSKWPRCS